jgi:hypothetical protein
MFSAMLGISKKVVREMPLRRCLNEVARMLSAFLPSCPNLMVQVLGRHDLAFTNVRLVNAGENYVSYSAIIQWRRIVVGCGNRRPSLRVIEYVGDRWDNRISESR